MKFFEQTKNFLVKNRLWITIVISVVLAAAFIGSVLGTMFSGGEFQTKIEYAEAKGTISVTNGCYSRSYLKGDTFAFDKENAEVRLLAKDPAIDDIINIESLPAEEYGFLVNGTGEYIENPSEIVMNEGVEKITLVSRAYRNLQVDLPVEIIDGYIDEEVLTSTLLIEAEETNLYSSDGKLLSAEDKKVLPDTNKPYISNVGGEIKGEKCSGGACIRNFSSGMTLEFEFVCSERTEVNLEIYVCKRPGAVNAFDDGYVTTLNGVQILTGANIPAGPSGDYFDPYSFTVTVTLQRGINTLTFEYGKSSPCNFDGIKLSSVSEDATNIFGPASALVYNNPVVIPEETTEETPEDGAEVLYVEPARKEDC